MKRSVQEIVELLVFGLIALLIGTALLWLVGWVFDLVGVLFKFFAGLIWSLLRFIVPVAIVAAIVYALVRLFQQQRERGNEQRQEAATVTTTPPPSETGERSPAAVEESGKPHASEIWAPPQPSPPAGPAPAEEPGEKPRAEQPEAVDEPGAGPFEEPPEETFEEPPLEEPTLDEPRLHQPPLDEWTVDSEPPVESTADGDGEPAHRETPPQPAEDAPPAEEDNGPAAEEEDIDGDRRS